MGQNHRVSISLRWVYPCSNHMWQIAQTGSVSSAVDWKSCEVGAAALAHSSYHSDGRCETLLVLTILRRRGRLSCPLRLGRHGAPDVFLALLKELSVQRESKVLFFEVSFFMEGDDRTYVPRVCGWLHGQWLRFSRITMETVVP